VPAICLSHRYPRALKGVCAGWVAPVTSVTRVQSVAARAGPVATGTSRAQAPPVSGPPRLPIARLAYPRSSSIHPPAMTQPAADLRLVTAQKGSRPRGVRVNTVNPGPVATDLWLGDDGVAGTVARASGNEPDCVARQLHRHWTIHPTRGRRRPDVLLASERASNVAGADFVIDGGLV
jgi:NAD(P)-dependent dehydrogenase (short-subunit alcohol dehydrogenase family)